MIALVLAAGSGTRLRPLTDDRPKALVAVGGRTILARLVEACAEAGMDRAVIVTGYRADAIDAVRGALALPAETVFNPEFDTRGNAWSVWHARQAVRGEDFVKLDGDILIDPAILRDVMAAPGSALALDDRAELDAEAMKAIVDGDQVAALGKDLPIARASGESIGVEKIAAADADRVFEAIHELVVDRGRPGAYYEDAYDVLVKQGWPLSVVRTAGRRWTEIDDAADLARAERQLRP